MPPPTEETERQYRVAKQTLGIHSALRDRFELLTTSAERILLVASVSLAIISLSPGEYLAIVGVKRGAAEFVLGLASLVAVVTSTALTLSGWRDRIRDHGRAVDRWSRVLSQYRRLRTDEGTWPPEARHQLNEEYWRANQNTVDIPDRKFAKYKGRYLRKVEASRLQDSYPAAPPILLRCLVTLRDIGRLIKGDANGRGRGE